MASSTSASSSVSFQPSMVITYQSFSPPATAPSPPDSRPTTITSTPPPTLPTDTPLPSLVELQSELVALSAAQHDNAATLDTLRTHLTTTTTSYSSLISFLQSSLSHRQATIARLTALRATTASANDTTASTLLASYHTSLATAHRLMRQQQTADETKYKSLKQQLTSPQTLHRLATKRQLEARIQQLKVTVAEDEVRRQVEFEAMKREIEEERASMLSVQQRLVEGREEREERYRRSVVREIEREKEGMMRVWEEERKGRRDRKEESERKRRLLAELEKERERLRQERELRESEAEQRRRMMRAREVKKERAMAVREEKEEQLLAAVMHSTNNAEEQRETAEQQAAVEQLTGQIEVEKAEVERLQEEEKEWTARGRRLLHQFDETQSLFQCLLHSLEAEKRRQQSSHALTAAITAADGVGEAGVVEWESMSVDDRIRLVKLLLYRSRGERGGIDLQTPQQSASPPVAPHPTAAKTPLPSSIDCRDTALERAADAEADRVDAAAEEWKEQIMERRRSMTGGHVDGRKTRGRSRMERQRQLSSAPIPCAEEEEDVLAVRGAAMVREWPAAMLPAIVAAVRVEETKDQV